MSEMKLVPKCDLKNKKKQPKKYKNTDRKHQENKVDMMGIV